MNIKAAEAFLRNLRSRKVAYKTPNGIEVTAKHTAKFSSDDYAVGLVFPEQSEFYPTHVRLLIDLHIKRISNPRDARALFCALERVFAGDDPDQFIEVVRALQFPMQLDDADVNLYYTQLLMVEQDFNYGPGGRKKSKLDPPREYLMRFVRWVYSQDNEIDKIITAAVRNWPAPAKYKQPIDCKEANLLS